MESKIFEEKYKKMLEAYNLKIREILKENNLKTKDDFVDYYCELFYYVEDLRRECDDDFDISQITQDDVDHHVIVNSFLEQVLAEINASEHKDAIKDALLGIS